MFVHYTLPNLYNLLKWSNVLVCRNFHEPRSGTVYQPFWMILGVFIYLSLLDNLFMLISPIFTFRYLFCHLMLT